MRYVSRFPLLAIIALVPVSCGGKDGGGTASTTPAATVPDAIIETVVAKLTTAYPNGLAISAFPKSTGGTFLASADPQSSNAETDDQPVSEKVKEAEKIMKGEGDSCLPAALKRAAFAEETESCYEFDQDTLYSEETANGTTTKRGTRDGKNSKGEACTVAFARSKIATVVDVVDRATGMVQVMFCQAQKEGKKNNVAVELPEVGKELDLKSAMGTAMGEKASKIDSAVLKRMTDADGRPVFQSKIEMTEKNGVKRTVTLVHSPASPTDNSTFEGTMTTKEDRSGATALHGNPGGSTKTRVLSVVYKRSVDSAGVPSMTYELRTARIVPELVDTALSGGVLDLNVSVNENGDYVKDGAVLSNPNELVDGIQFIGFNLNPLTNAGIISYWQNPGGNYNESARGMVAKLEAASDGTMSGCAVTGAGRDDQGQGLSIRKAIKAGVTISPNSFYHPFYSTEQGGTTTGSDSIGTWHERTQANPGGGNKVQRWYVPLDSDATKAVDFATKQTGLLVSKQCFAQDAEGVYKIDTAKTTQAAGVELVSTSDTTKLIAPPEVKGLKRIEAKPPTAY